MTIQSSDKLLIGRDGQSFQTDFENSGIPTKDNLDEHLHKTAGGTVVGNTQYTGDITLDNHIANKGYVDTGLSNYIPITGSEAGKPVTGDIDLSNDTFLNVAGNGAGVRIKPGYWGGLKYDDQLQLEWGAQGVKMGVDINMKIGNTDFTNAAENQYNGTDEFSGNSIHWLKAPEHKYDAVNKNYVDENFATTEYVDTEIANLGDLLVFKGTIDFTTTPAPTEFATGHVYANSVAGTPDPSWGLSDDVSVGDLYGRGENQWGIVGSTQGETGEFLLKGGDTVNTGSEVVYDFQNGIKFNNWGKNFTVQHNVVQIEADYDLNLVATDDIDLRTIDGGNISLRPSGVVDVNNKYIRHVKTPYGDGDAANKGYVDNYAMPKNLNTLPAMP